MDEDRTTERRTSPGSGAAGERSSIPPREARRPHQAQDRSTWDLPEDLRDEIERVAADRGWDPAWLADTILRRGLARLPSIARPSPAGGGTP